MLTEKQKSNVHRWIEALRSGKYPECTTQDIYCAAESQTIYGMNCLGVLLRMFQREFNIQTSVDYHNAAHGYPIKFHNRTCGTTDEVRNAVGLYTNDGLFYKKQYGCYRHIVHLNAGMSHSQISDLIEKEMEINEYGLFWY